MTGVTACGDSYHDSRQPLAASTGGT